MSWSLSSVSFRMSGSGSWQNLLPDEASRRLYAELYPLGSPFPIGPGPLQKLFSAWKQAAIVRVENEKVVPLGPIMTDDDLIVLNPWFQDISSFMCQAVLERMGEYSVLASNLAGGHSSRKQDVDNILTILIGALTLDSRVFSMLRGELIGTYPPRNFAGIFFFWGYAFAEGPQRIFGFTTYNGLDEKQLHMIRSHGLDRRGIKAVLNQRKTWDYLSRYFKGLEEGPRADLLERPQSPGWKTVEGSLQNAGLLTSDNPSLVAIPIFDNGERETISELCRKTSKKITDYFVAGMEELKALVELCSFAQCSRPDVLCMLFHLAYSYAVDQLVEKGFIPDFPISAGGEWGVWIS